MRPVSVLDSWVQPLIRQTQAMPSWKLELAEKTNIEPMITQIMKCFTQNYTLTVFSYGGQT